MERGEDPAMFLLDSPPQTPRGSLLLAQGSGAPWDSPFMNRAAAILAECGLEVYRFRFQFSQLPGRRPPSPFAQLRREFEEALEHCPGTAPLLVGGKSLGGRVGLSLVSHPKVEGAILLAYPFHPPRKPEKLRLEGFRDLEKPVLLLQGTRDPFGRPSEVAEYALPASVSVAWLEGADHDFRGLRSSPESWSEARRALDLWLSTKDSFGPKT